MGVEVKGAGDGVESRTEAVTMVADIEIIPVGALDGEPLVVHW
jgi:hypothetical protein